MIEGEKGPSLMGNSKKGVYSQKESYEKEKENGSVHDQDKECTTSALMVANLGFSLNNKNDEIQAECLP